MDIVEYVSNLTRFVFTEGQIKVIIIERADIGVDFDSDPLLLTSKQRDLLMADCLYLASSSPTVLGSINLSHGNYKQDIKGETITNRQHIITKAMSIYKRWGDRRYDETGFIWEEL